MDDRRKAFWEQLQPFLYDSHIVTLQTILGEIKVRAEGGEFPAIKQIDEDVWEQVYAKMKEQIPTATHAVHPFIGECMRELRDGYFGRLSGCYAHMNAVHRLYLEDEHHDGSRLVGTVHVLYDQLQGVAGLIGTVTTHPTFRRYWRDVVERAAKSV
jgi:hypothetical protein